jgi:hypothetical protein
VKHRILIVAAGCLAALAASLPVQAQGVPGDIAFQVASNFTVDGKDFKAGKYLIKPSNKETNGLLVQRMDTNLQRTTELSAMTRLARQHQSDAPKGSLVFDKVAGGQLALSEVWLPGQDGYLIAATKGEHQHEVVEVK